MVGLLRLGTNSEMIIMKYGFLLILIFFLSTCRTSKQSMENRMVGKTMGTRYQVKISQLHISDENLNLLKHKIDSVLIDVNHQMSTYDPKSEISQFNDFADTSVFRVSASFGYVVQRAMEINRQSEGYFDITVAPLVDLWGFGKKGHILQPPVEEKVRSLRKKVGSGHLTIVDSTHLKKDIPELELDLGAIAKGYGVDAVARYLLSAGYDNFLVEIGGEVVARGVNARNELWKVGIDRPQFSALPGEDIQGILKLKDIAVATSGDYRNYFEHQGKQFSHTIDPFTGYPVTHDLASVTIIADNCTWADGLATAVMAMGREKGLPWIEAIPRVEALLIVRREAGIYREFQTEGFGNFIVEE